MLLGTKKTLHDHITEILLGDSLGVSQIQKLLASKKVSASVQGIYKTLRELMSEDIVVKQKKIYSINNIWRNKLEKIVSRKSIFKLFPSEQVVYRFTNIEHTDAFWKHTFADIKEQFGSFPVFHFMPHQYWLLIPTRAESEYEYYDRYTQEKTYDFNIVGGITIFDESVKKSISSDFNQIHLDSRTSFNRRDHLSIIGPYIITTRVSVSLARVTDRLYETCFTEDELARKLEPEFKKHGSVTMMVEHNLEKAKSMRKKMSADFHIPRELREQFDLF